MSSCDDDGVQRRKGDYHSNLWDDDFIQSLSTPGWAPCYRERAERLVEEIKEIFNSVTVPPFNDPIQGLSMVDSVERLGIDRHLKNEIKSVLDYVYSYWSEKGIGCGKESAGIDLNTTALWFRTLRLHGYPVSSDVLKVFKDSNGQFASSASNLTEAGIRGVLNLFRASLVAFPGEKVIEEAEVFCTTYLKEALKKGSISNGSLSQEIEYVLEYRWLTNFPRLEARNYIEVFGKDTNPLLETRTKNEKLLEFAKLEFNIFHSMQQKGSTSPVPF